MRLSSKVGAALGLRSRTKQVLKEPFLVEDPRGTRVIGRNSRWVLT